MTIWMGRFAALRISLKLSLFTAALLFVPCLLLAANPATGNISYNSTSSLSWQGTAVGTGAAQDESTCVEGVNCDSFAINVQGTDAQWQNAILQIQLTWGVPANDYDMFVHKGSLTGPVVTSSANGAPETEQGPVVIDPHSMGTGLYTVHVCYWLTSPNVDQYVGTAKVTPRPKAKIPHVLSLPLCFCASMPLAAPGTTADGEPSVRCDSDGNWYIAGIRGVPAGVDLWHFDLNPNSPTYDPLLHNPTYLGQPDSFSPTQAFSVGADGGGDVDVAVGHGNGPNGVPNIAMSSLTIANISTETSSDLGQTWTKNPTGNVTGGAAVDDRQWEAFYGPKTVYLYYRTFDPAVSQIQQSTDGGLTFGPAITAGTLGQAGSIDVDQADGTVYVSGSTGQVAVGKPDPILGYPTSYTVVQAAQDPNGVANLFFVVKVGPDGTVYGTYSNGKDIFLIYSTDKGQTWSQPMRMNYGLLNTTCLFPALAVGRVKGSVAVAWYGTSDAINEDNSDWRVFVAQTTNALDPVPTVCQMPVSDHVIHAANISLGGTFGNANRNLLDYFQIAYDPIGALVVAYTDDHEDFTGNVYATRQITGYNDEGQHLPSHIVEGSKVPPLAPFSTDGSQVVDPEGDLVQGLLVNVPGPDPLDITSITYASKPVGNDILLTATMKVSDLSSIPLESTWRMDFSANCPNTGVSFNGRYSLASSDRGDRFWLSAFSGAQQNHVAFQWGTYVRNSDGSLTYTEVRPADYGVFDTKHNTITVGVLLSNLNKIAKKGKIGPGSVLTGLRGSAFNSQESAAKEDTTRGGLEYKIPSS